VPTGSDTATFDQENTQQHILLRWHWQHVFPVLGYAVCAGWQESGVRKQESGKPNSNPTAFPNRLSLSAPTVFDNPWHP